MEKLFHDQDKNMQGYEEVFNQLKTLQPKAGDVTINVCWEHDDFDNEDYVDVSGYYTHPKIGTDEAELSLALEFTPWEEWLAMPIDEKTLESFSELEIIAHCLWEMTFMGFDQEEIQEELDTINKSAEEYDSMTPEERAKNTYSMEELKNMLGISDDEEDNSEENENKDKK
jgi:hypothetical protein